MPSLCSLLLAIILLPVVLVVFAVLLVFLLLLLLIAGVFGCVGSLLKPLDKDLANYLYHMPYGGVPKTNSSKGSGTRRNERKQAASKRSADCCGGRRDPVLPGSSNTGPSFAPASATAAETAPVTEGGTEAPNAASRKSLHRDDKISSNNGRDFLYQQKQQQSSRRHSPVPKAACDAV